MAADAGDICYSIVVPVFNEEAVLPALLRRLDILMDGLSGGSDFRRRREQRLQPDQVTPLMRRIERGLRNLPFGAQYIACGVA